MRMKFSWLYLPANRFSANRKRKKMTKYIDYNDTTDYSVPTLYKALAEEIIPTGVLPVNVIQLSISDTPYFCDDLNEEASYNDEEILLLGAYVWFPAESTILSIRFNEEWVNDLDEYEEDVLLLPCSIPELMNLIKSTHTNVGDNFLYLEAEDGTDAEVILHFYKDDHYLLYPELCLNSAGEII